MDYKELYLSKGLNQDKLTELMNKGLKKRSPYLTISKGTISSTMRNNRDFTTIEKEVFLEIVGHSANETQETAKERKTDNVDIVSSQQETIKTLAYIAKSVIDNSDGNNALKEV